MDIISHIMSCHVRTWNILYMEPALKAAEMNLASSLPADVVRISLGSLWLI